MLAYIPPSQQDAYRRTLRTPHQRRIRVHLMNRAGTRVVADLSDRLLGGQVVADDEQQVSRSAGVQILDPSHELGFDSDTFQGQDLDFTRQLRLWWGINGPLLNKPLWIPVHTGPVVRLRREGSLVTVEAQSREMIGLTPTRRTLELKKGMRRTEAIKTILRERMGETRLGNIPDLPQRLPDDVVVGPKDQPMTEIRKLAASLSRRFLYGPNGVPYLLSHTRKPKWRFQADAAFADITSPVVSEADLQAIKNHVRMTGHTPKNQKKPVSGHATAGRRNPLSPWELAGAPGVPMWLIEEASNDHLRSDKECREAADDLLDRRLRLVHNTSFNAGPVPHLEPHDLIRVDTAHESGTSKVGTFTLPFDGSDMSIGYIDPYKLRPRAS